MTASATPQPAVGKGWAKTIAAVCAAVHDSFYEIDITTLTDTTSKNDDKHNQAHRCAYAVISQTASRVPQLKPPRDLVYCVAYRTAMLIADTSEWGSAEESSRWWKQQLNRLRQRLRKTGRDVTWEGDLVWSSVTVMKDYLQRSSPPVDELALLAFTELLEEAILRQPAVRVSGDCQL